MNCDFKCSCRLLETLQQFKVLIFRLRYSHFQNMIKVPISKYEVQVSLPPSRPLSLPSSHNHSLTHPLTWSPTQSSVNQSISQSVTHLLFYLFTESLTYKALVYQQSFYILYAFELHLKTDYRIQNIKTDVCTLY